MRISLAYNLKEADHEAEFDSQSTIDFITQSITSLGHEVMWLEARDIIEGKVDRFVKKLRKQSPDLIFNIAEGSGGQARAALLPAIFESMKIPYTGSNTGAISLAANKFSTSKLFIDDIVACPQSFRFSRASYQWRKARITLNKIDFPVIIKPNLEGSSIGIDQNSIVTNPSSQLKTVLDRQIHLYNDVMVEQYIDGLDVSIAWIDGIGDDGVLPPASYHYNSTGQHHIYDLSLKRTGQNLVEAKVPADIPQATSTAIESAIKTIVSTIGIEGMCRADFRIDGDSGIPYFIEVNPLPSLAPGTDAEMYRAVEMMGGKVSDIYAAIIRAACKKFNL